VALLLVSEHFIGMEYDRPSLNPFILLVNCAWNTLTVLGRHCLNLDLLFVASK